MIFRQQIRCIVGHKEEDGNERHFSIGTDLIQREMIAAYAILKKAGANANHAG
jgi:fumarate hydratase class II